MTVTRARRPPLLLVAFPLLVVLVGASCGNSGGDQGSARPPSAQSEGAQAVDGDLPSIDFEMADRSQANLADLVAGKPLVLNFFASWCPPCRAEMPGFQRVYADVQDQVSFFGLDLQDTRDAGAALVEETGVRFPWGLDPDGSIYVALGGFAMPTTIYVSAEGEILAKDNGQISESDLRGRLREHFGVGA